MSRSCVLLLWVGLVVSPGYVMSEDGPMSGSSWWKTPDQRGAELLQSGDAGGASQVFRDSRWRGVSQYRNGNFAEAQKEFSTGTDPSSLYNAGTAAAKAGDYETAIEKFEQVIEADPDHEDAAHNLDISRQLRKNQQQSSDQQGDSGDGDDSEQSDDSQSQQGDQEQGEQDQDGQQQESEQGQQSEQQSGNSDQNADEKSNQDGKGELSTDAEDAKAAGQDAQQQDATEQSEEKQSAVSQGQDEPQQAQDGGAQQAQTDAESAEAGDAARATESARREPISESEQATEQWMRRIPDDPSQLLRNKIKLNHMIQHENVTDLPEPW